MKFPEITSVSVGINPREIQQAFSNLIAPIITASVHLEKFGEAACLAHYAEGGKESRGTSQWLAKSLSVVARG